MKIEYLDHMGSDITVVNAARVSFGKRTTELTDKDVKLINYLAKHHHISPFHHPQIQVRVTIPIFIARQLEKHVIGFAGSGDRIVLDKNEVSRRYVVDKPKFFIPTEWRSKPEGSIKQGSGDGTITFLNGGASIDYWVDEVYNSSLRLYEAMLESGVAPEQARMVLPQATYTSWVWTGSLAAYMRVYKLRIDGHAQREIQEIAKQIKDVVEPLFPVSWKALESVN